MADAARIVLCIEPDGATAAEIRGALEPYGFRVEDVPEGDKAIEWGRQNPPALIILSIEPRKIGYAICNKIKRSPTLRDIKLILTSSEETQKAFDQHRALKTHADEYAFKPLDVADLLGKIDRLIGLGELRGVASGVTGEIAIDVDAPMELDVGDSDILTEHAAVTPSPTALVGARPGRGRRIDPDVTASYPRDEEEEELTGSTRRSPAEARLLDGVLDAETQAAFAALEATDDATGPLGPPVMTPKPMTGSSVWAGEPAGTSPEPGHRLAPESAAEVAASVIEAAVPAGADDVLPYDVKLDPPQEPATEEPHTGFESDSDTSAEPSPLLASAEPSPLLEAREAPREPPTVPFATARALLESTVPPGLARPGAAPAAELHGESSPPMAYEEGLSAELEDRVKSLDAELARLRTENDELRMRADAPQAPQAFSKEKEFLNLREIINKKEKDILDLRDALDARERQTLDFKDKIRELERARRDMEERVLVSERNLVAASEKAAALGSDKERSVEREKGLKGRLDDAHVEIRKAHDEVEGLKRKVVTAEDRVRGELERTRTELEARIAEMEEAHRVETTRVSDEHSAAEARLEAAREADLARLAAAHSAEVDSLQRRFSDEQEAAAERNQTEITRMRRDNDKALAALREELAVQLAAERQAHETALEERDRAHRGEIADLRRRGEDDLAAAEERRQRDLSEEEARRMAALDAAEARRRVEMQARDDEHHAQVTEMERRHLDEKTELTERHRAELDQANGRAIRAEGDLAARSAELDETRRRLGEEQADLGQAQAELRDHEVRLEKSTARVSELEAKVGEQEDQILRAFQRIRADEKAAEKAKRALAVALTLLDERAGGSTVAASTGKATPEDQSSS